MTTLKDMLEFNIKRLEGLIVQAFSQAAGDVLKRTDSLENLSVSEDLFSDWELPLSVSEMREILPKEICSKHDRLAVSAEKSALPNFDLIQATENATLNAYRAYSFEYCKAKLKNLVREPLLGMVENLGFTTAEPFFQFDAGTGCYEIKSYVLKLTASTEGDGQFIVQSTDSKMTIKQMIDAEVKGCEGYLGRISSDFEAEMANTLHTCQKVIAALVDQVEDYSENEYVIGKNDSYHIADIKGFLDV